MVLLQSPTIGSGKKSGKGPGEDRCDSTCLVLGLGHTFKDTREFTDPLNMDRCKKEYFQVKSHCHHPQITRLLDT